MSVKPHNPALFLAKEKFIAGNHYEMAKAAGAKFDRDKGIIESVFMGRPCYVSCADGEVESEYYKDILDNSHRVLVLNNLLTATGRSLTEKLIAYREIRGTGAGAIAGLHGIKMEDIAGRFGKDPESIYKVLDTIPGVKASLGDASVCVNLLSRVPVTFVIWAGEDDIIPPAANVLFDSAVCDYTPHPDIPVMLETAVCQIMLR